MPKLTIKKKAEIIREINFTDAAPLITLGSEIGNEVVIDDKLVSQTHARIERQFNRYYLRDMNSAFGTYLNGKKIDTPAALGNGDIFQLGDHSIIFDDAPGHGNFTEHAPAKSPFMAEAQKGGEAGFYRTTGVTLMEQIVQEPAVNVPSSFSQQKGELAPYHLLAIYGPYAGKRFQLRYGETKIGRDETLNDIVLSRNKQGQSDHSISRRHATILYKSESDSFSVVDKRSKTRTHVNQMVVPFDGEIELYPKDEIEIVSDQQSTIFRFVAQEDFDFNPPKKAGVWWVRHQSRFKVGLAALVVLAGALLLAQGFLEFSMITQKPNPLSLELSHWVTDTSAAETEMFSANPQLQRLPRSAPAAADFDGDGYVDVAATSLGNKPLLIDGRTRLPKWIIDTAPADPSSALMAADVNQNQLPDVIYLSSDGRLVAIDGNHGAEIWASPFNQLKFSGPPVIADVNGDALPDIAIADVSGRVHIGYNRIITMEWTSIETEIPITAPLSCADLDNDGAGELVCGSDRGLLFIIDGVNRKLFTTIDINEELNRARGTFYEDNQIHHPVGVADLNGDSFPDLLVSTLQGRLLAINGRSKERLWYDVYTNELTLASSYPFPFALGEFDSDGLTDVVVSTHQGEIIAYRGKGAEQQPSILWRQTLDKSAAAQQNLVLGDVNKDNRADLIFLDAAGKLQILDGRNGSSLWSASQSFPALTSLPLVADLNKDSLLDILLVSEAGIVLQYKTNGRVSKSAVIWGQQFGSSQNTLSEAYRLPQPLPAQVAMGVGVLLLLGGGTSTYFIKRKRH